MLAAKKELEVVMKRFSGSDLPRHVARTPNTGTIQANQMIGFRSLIHRTSTYSSATCSNLFTEVDVDHLNDDQPSQTQT